MTLANEIKSFIANYIATDKWQHYGGYEDRLDDAIYYLTSLCTTPEEYEIVKAIISLENH